MLYVIYIIYIIGASVGKALNIIIESYRALVLVIGISGSGLGPMACGYRWTSVPKCLQKTSNHFFHSDTVALSVLRLRNCA